RQSRPLRCGETGAIHAQGLEALLGGPFRKVGVVALARHHEWRQQRDASALVVPQQPRCDRSGALRLDGHFAVGAMLGAELHVQEPQKVIDLSKRGHRALAPATTGALLDGDRGRNAEYRIDIGTRRGLNELPGIRIQRLEVTALTLIEEDVERERRLARPRYPGDDREFVAR